MGLGERQANGVSN